MTPTFGWRYDPAESAKFRATLANPYMPQAAPHLLGTGGTVDAFAWEFEEKVLGKLLAAWNQGSVGSCVSHGWGRTLQDLLLTQITRGAAEQWPGAEVNRETIYGGSRVEIGGERGSYQDGSVGAWAADWVRKYGILFNMKYGSIDLSNGYDERRCKEYGAKGCPDELEPISRQHPVKDMTTVTTVEQLDDLLSNLYWTAVCGNTSRTMKRRPGGWCPKTGNDWPHCEQFCGICTVKGGSSSPWGGDGAVPYAGNTRAIAERNSWGDYLGSENNQVELASGRTIKLPDGVYLSTLDERKSDLRQEDTFAPAHAQGFPAQKIPWIF